MRKMVVAYFIDERTNEQVDVLIHSVEMLRSDDTANIRNYIDYILSKYRTVNEIVDFVMKNNSITINACLYAKVQMLGCENKKVITKYDPSENNYLTLNQNVFVLVDLNKRQYQILTN